MVLSILIFHLSKFNIQATFLMLEGMLGAKCRNSSLGLIKNRNFDTGCGKALPGTGRSMGEVGFLLKVLALEFPLQRCILKAWRVA